MPDDILLYFKELFNSIGSQNDEPAFWLMLGSSALFLLASLFALFSESDEHSSTQDQNSDLDYSDLDYDDKEQEIALGSASVDSGLSKTRNRLFSGLSQVFKGKSRVDDEVLSSLEELLITSDLGVATTEKLLGVVKLRAAQDKDIQGVAGLVSCLRSAIMDVLSDSLGGKNEIRIDSSKSPFVILVVGVNGVGKTTTIGKLAHSFASSGQRVLLAAGDTFRAAAVEQLEAWSKRAGVDIVLRKGDNIKPSTVVYEAVEKAKSESYDVLIIDTAGRLHTRVNLMNELEKVYALLGREMPGAPHESILVLDASTGQNALQQAREFNKRTALSGLVVTKLDGTPKGGIVIAIKDELGIPIRYIGVGEGLNDLKPFQAEDFVNALLGDSASQEKMEIGSDSEDSADPNVQEDLAEGESSERGEKRVAKRKRRHQ